MGNFLRDLPDVLAAAAFVLVCSGLFLGYVLWGP